MARHNKSLAESLLELGLLTAPQITEAQKQEKETGYPLRKIIVQKNFISEEDLVSFMASNMNLPRVELNNYIIDPKIIELIPEDLARKHQVIPLLKISHNLTCVMFDPLNLFAIDELRNITGFNIEPALATEKEIKSALDEYYSVKGSLEDIIKSIDKERLGLKEGQDMELKKLEEVSAEPPVTRLVNLIIMQAVKERASDIHIEPEEETLKVRYRIDGILHDRPFPPKYLQSVIVSRIKILSNLNIAERRAPQDGRFQIKMENKEIDIRISVVPTIYGENIVMRLLDRRSAILSLGELGFSQEVLEKYDKLLRRPSGIILVTGPTGSGKTTTLYASLNIINSEDKNIVTIEDPVEYHLAGIRQIQVDPKANITFANGLRSILRQDPDVIMVGEIRDKETAEIAIQAALTGHLVFSTLHTNDAAGAVTRLNDMAVEPFLICSSVSGVLAQRLVRKICPDCKEKYTPDKEASMAISLNEEEKIDFYRGKGCPKCLDTGYRGRIGIFELMIVNEKIHNLIIAKSPRDEINRQAESLGMVSLRDDGVRKVKQGLTTIEEVLRLTQEE